MSVRRSIMVDGNEAVASVAHRTNEVIAIYPITPSSGMGELADEWSVAERRNLWGTVPEVAEMQAEGGAAGAVHGALQAGALATTFTASQGLLLMIPNMYKMAGELSPFCMHVAARTVATHALSIFGDHSDVMACRQTGFAMLASNSVQEAHDFACISQAATLQSRIPFLHFFDGFRTSHELSRIEELTDDDLRFMIDDEHVEAHRLRGLTPDKPVVRGTAQNPDTFFQAREACNTYYDRCIDVVAETMDRFASLTGRHYRLFDYCGHPQAERVIVMMGSGAETVEETVRHHVKGGEKIGLIKVRLYRPFSKEHLLKALPATVRAIAVLDRTKEPGAPGEPLFLDMVMALRDRKEGTPTIIGGRYGLSSKEFHPGMVKAVFDELSKDEPKSPFTVGIMDDVTHLSLTVDGSYEIKSEGLFEAVFFGLGSDGTVGANKNSIKIIGGETDHYAQGYFVYDSKKSGAVTISHLRFGPQPIRSPYLIRQTDFVACHQFGFLDRYDVLEYARPGSVFLLNAPYPADEVWQQLPREVQQLIVDKDLQCHVIDAYKVAADVGMGQRINTIMQTCFFAISGVLPRDEAMAQIKATIEKTYGKKGAEIVRRNHEAVEQTLQHLYKLEHPQQVTAEKMRPAAVSEAAPDFVKRVTGVMLQGHGDKLPVSAFPVDGTWPTGTSRWEKRNIAREIPIWDADLCIQCNKCAMVCPHAAIRAKVYKTDALEGAPADFLSTTFRGKEFKEASYTIQVAPEDCTGCTLCVEVCPAKDKASPRHKAINMRSHDENLDRERSAFEFFLKLPEADRTALRLDVKGTQFMKPLFEFSGACSGCGETPYIKLLSQLFGDRALIANATGCSSIYGGNLPTTPYTVNEEGRGPAWANSLFEDNAEFGIGMRLAVDMHRDQAIQLLETLADRLNPDLVKDLLAPSAFDEQGIADQRARVVALRLALAGIDDPAAARLTALADYLVRKSVWLVGGDGWAYDIGYGGLDHVLGMNRNVNILVLDTEVYSNTGGQQSKATPLGASAKFAVAGKEIPKKDLGMEAMSYGHVYVARVAFGAKDAQTVKAFVEAESWPGPSLIIAYSPCIAHGYNLAQGNEHQKIAVQSGYWPLYRYDPRNVERGKPPLSLDSGRPKVPVSAFMKNEARFRMVQKMNPIRYKRLAAMAQTQVDRQFSLYEQLAGITIPQEVPDGSQD